LRRSAAEIHQNSASQAFYILTRDKMKAFVYPPGRNSLFLGRWQVIPSNIVGVTRKAETRVLGQRIVLERTTLVLRQGTRVLLEGHSIRNMHPGSVLPWKTPLVLIKSQMHRANDITSGIPRIATLMEIRPQTGIPALLINLYRQFSYRGCSNAMASRKSIHLRQRILVDRVQRNYRTNGVALEDKHLELIIRPIAFARLIKDPYKSWIHGEDYPLDVLERINWCRSLKDLRDKNALHFNKLNVLYKPVLFGLTKGGLRSASFLSAASYRETSRVLAASSFNRRVDYLSGLKENLILGAPLPIGSNSRFLMSNILRNYKPNSSKKTWKNKLLINTVIQRDTSPFFIDALLYFKDNEI
jgi:hypothetical protein